MIAFDYEIVCQRAANDQDLQLTLHNQISRMISDYAPQAVFITKESWPILRQEFIAGGQTFNTGELDEGEAEPEPTTEEPENEVVVTKAQELLVNWRASKKIERIGGRTMMRGMGNMQGMMKQVQKCKRDGKRTRSPKQ